ncbi:MCE family protein [Mycolicibacterium lacusdiani]|uniref:MCE family protein n=1 Tax=Mycolicibacterium lacusdiani TaxID=2895283 RepID=UPI001F46F86B|nr:MCE family protein [Mycolicibacterium lacusdiani]
MGTGDKHLGWWTTILLTVVIGLVTLSWALFNGSFRSSAPVTLTSDRSGLVMEPGSKVRFRGVQVGQVRSLSAGTQSVKLQLEIDSEEMDKLPANVSAQIRATTVFGAKYVDLIYPEHPQARRLAAGAVLQSRNVSTEVNTVFQNLLQVLTQLDPAKLNATLTALAEGVRGQGEDIGAATTDANEVLLAVNPRMDTVREDLRSLSGFSRAYGGAAQDILKTLSSVSTTSTTITNRAADLDALLLNVVGFAQAGTNLIQPSQSDLVKAVNVLEPTTNLLMKYSPSYTCMLLGATWFLDNGGRDALGAGDGRSGILDATFLLGDDEYKYPVNLPVVAAKGGPGGKPGCGSLPDPSKNYPVRQLVSDTGWGTGLDIRPNPGIGHPFYANYLPATRAVPQAPSIRGEGPPAIGPIPYPGAPPYGAPQYGPDGTPLHPPPPGTSPTLPLPALPPVAIPPDVPGTQP